MLYVGLDVHSRQSSLCILNSAGGVVNQVQLKGSRALVVDRLRQLDQPFSVCYEASCGYGQLYEALRPLAHHVAVAHPGKLRLIYGSKRKNDRVDAQKLAKLLLLDMVPPVHVPSIDVRGWRSLIILRQRVMSRVVRAKNQIRAVLRENDIAGAKWLWFRATRVAPIAATAAPGRAAAARPGRRGVRVARSEGQTAGSRTAEVRRPPPGGAAADDDPRRRHPHRPDLRRLGR